MKTIGLPVMISFVASCMMVLGCTPPFSGQREIKIRFFVDPQFEGLVYVKEDPDLQLDFERTYDIRINNGEALLPKGFLTGPQPVFWRVVEVADAASGNVLSSGHDLNDPPKGTIGVRNLIGLSGPGARSGYYFVISDGSRGTFELAEAHRKRQLGVPGPKITCRLILEKGFEGTIQIVEDPAMDLEHEAVYDLVVRRGNVSLPSGSFKVLGRRGSPELELDIVEISDTSGNVLSSRNNGPSVRLSTSWSADEGERYYLTVSKN